MVFAKQRLARLLLSFGIIAFLLIGVLGLSNFGMTMKMDMEGNMTMSDCFMPGMTTICNMNPLEHIAMWQNMFLAIPQQTGVFALLLLLVFTIVAFAVGWLRRQYPPPKDDVQSYRRYLARSYCFPPTPLQILFSDGILNPKLF